MCYWPDEFMPYPLIEKFHDLCIIGSAAIRNELINIKLTAGWYKVQTIKADVINDEYPTFYNSSQCSIKVQYDAYFIPISLFRIFKRFQPTISTYISWKSKQLERALESILLCHLGILKNTCHPTDQIKTS